MLIVLTITFDICVLAFYPWFFRLEWDFFFLVVGAELIAGSLLTLKSLLVPFGLDEGWGRGYLKVRGLTNPLFWSQRGMVSHIWGACKDTFYFWTCDYSTIILYIMVLWCWNNETNVHLPAASPCANASGLEHCTSIVQAQIYSIFINAVLWYCMLFDCVCVSLLL